MAKKDCTKTSFYIPNDLLEAMRKVREKEKVNLGSQVELGLRLYLEKHKEMLKAEGTAYGR